MYLLYFLSNINTALVSIRVFNSIKSEIKLFSMVVYIQMASLQTFARKKVLKP